MPVSHCVYCHEQADFIDTVTGKCPECLKDAEIEAANLVSRQTTEGVTAHLRARAKARAAARSS